MILLNGEPYDPESSSIQVPDPVSKAEARGRLIGHPWRASIITVGVLVAGGVIEMQQDEDETEAARSYSACSLAHDIAEIALDHRAANPGAWKPKDIGGYGHEAMYMSTEGPGDDRVFVEIGFDSNGAALTPEQVLYATMQSTVDETPSRPDYLIEAFTTPEGCSMSYGYHIGDDELYTGGRYGDDVAYPVADDTFQAVAEQAIAELSVILDGDARAVELPVAH